MVINGNVEIGAPSSGLGFPRWAWAGGPWDGGRWTANCVGGAVPRSASIQLGSWGGPPTGCCTLHAAVGSLQAGTGGVPGYAGHSWHSADRSAYTVQLGYR